MGSSGTLRTALTAFLLSLSLSLAGCQSASEEAADAQVTLLPVSFADLPGWQADSVSAALPALKRSCERLLPRADEALVGPDGLAGRVADWRPICKTVSILEDGDERALRRVLQAHLQPYEVFDGDDPNGLFTGYYEAELQGSLEPDATYRWPIYRRPADLVTLHLGEFRADLEGERLVGKVADGRFVPYPDRGAIDGPDLNGGVLAGRDLELVWVDDPLDRFFLHIQGSGIVVLPEGEGLRVGYDGNNGHGYQSVGRVLIREGHLQSHQASAQGIRDWFAANPDQTPALLAENPRYIFFREITGEGPIGAQGVALTAGRSLAIDPAFLPLGAPLWLDTTWPNSERPLQRLMVTQDTGSAIKGPVRGDFYWGSGDAALAEAGRMKQQGRYFLLLPKNLASRPVS